MSLEKLLVQLVEEAKKDKGRFAALKNTVVKCQQFELAASLREIEKELFPESEETKKDKEYAKELVNLFAMLGLKVPNETAFLIGEGIKVHNKKKGKFDLHDAAKIECRKREIFPEPTTH